MASIGVIGSGTWGTALAVLLADKGYPVVIWSAIHEEALSLSESRRHPNLPGIAIAETIEITEDLEQAMKDKDLLVMAVPSVFVRQTAAKMKPWCRDGQIVVNVAKGIEEDTLMTLSQVIEDELPMADVAVLSGPSHAEEVSRGLPTTCVSGAHSRKTAEFVQDIFMNQVFRVYTSPDILGIELGASLKNVIALAGDMGLEIKPNYQAKAIDGNCIDMLGFRVYRTHVEIRKSIFIRVRRAYKKIRKAPTVRIARKCISYYGYLKYSNSRRIEKRWKVKSAIKKCKGVIRGESKIFQPATVG